MSKTSCRLCRNVRLVALSIVLGGGGGLAVDALGGSAGWSMAVTFLGALAPILWQARRERRAAAGDD